MMVQTTNKLILGRFDPKLINIGPAIISESRVIILKTDTVTSQLSAYCIDEDPPSDEGGTSRPRPTIFRGQKCAAAADRSLLVRHSRAFALLLVL